MKTLVKHIALADFLNMDFEDPIAHLFELINGEIVKRSAPSSRHQKIVYRLHKKIDEFLNAKNTGEVYGAPLDVFLNEETCVQPDLFFVRKSNLKIVDEDNGVKGIPDLTIEVISRQSAKRDRITKMQLYYEAGVKEYWLIDPSNETFEIYTKNKKGYDCIYFEAETGTIKSIVMKGFEMNIATLFDN